MWKGSTRCVVANMAYRAKGKKCQKKVNCPARFGCENSDNCALKGKTTTKTVEAPRKPSERPDYHLWYGLKEWKQARSRCLQRCPICISCWTKENRVVAGAHCDHIHDYQGNWELFIEPLNHQSLCHTCHSRKTSATSNRGIPYEKSWDFSEQMKEYYEKSRNKG